MIKFKEGSATFITILLLLLLTWILYYRLNDFNNELKINKTLINKYNSYKTK